MTRDLALATIVALTLHAAALVAVDRRRSIPPLALETTPSELSITMLSASATTHAIVEEPTPSPSEPASEPAPQPAPQPEKPSPLEPLEDATVIGSPVASDAPDTPFEPVRPEPVTPAPAIVEQDLARVVAAASPAFTRIEIVRLDPSIRPLVLPQGWPWIPPSAISPPSDETPADPEPLARRLVDLTPVETVPPSEHATTPPAARRSPSSATDAGPARSEPEATSGGALQGPVVSSNPRPTYPRVARQRGYEGEVLLRIEVLETGSVGRVEVLSSSGHDVLDRAATRAVRRWRFEPATRRGVPESRWIEVPVEFRIEDTDRD